jgi:hypothetical protein
MFHILKPLVEHQTRLEKENVAFAVRMKAAAVAVTEKRRADLAGVCCSWAWCGHITDARNVADDELERIMDRLAERAIAVRADPNDAAHHKQEYFCKVVDVRHEIVVDQRTRRTIKQESDLLDNRTPTESEPDAPYAASNAYYCVCTASEDIRRGVCEFGFVSTTTT